MTDAAPAKCEKCAREARPNERRCVLHEDRATYERYAKARGWLRSANEVNVGLAPQFRCPACRHWCNPYEDDVAPGWICNKRGGCGAEWPQL